MCNVVDCSQVLNNDALDWWPAQPTNRQRQYLTTQEQPDLPPIGNVCIMKRKIPQQRQRTVEQLQSFKHRYEFHVFLNI